MIINYDKIHFIHEDGTLDLTTNVQRMGKVLQTKGFVRCRREQYINAYGLHIYTHDYFSPITSTRVMRKSKNTYCIHHYASSWNDSGKSNLFIDNKIMREIINALVQIKRKLIIK